MSVSRVSLVEARFLAKLRALREFDISGSAATAHLNLTSDEDGHLLWDLYDSQICSRLLDYAARALKETGEGYYTIGSAGHEGNVVLGRLLRPTDPTLLHYRSGALVLERLRQDSTQDRLETILLSLCASSADPVSGGRHKVFGSRRLWMPPQTSTIASHLPKALGLALSLERAKRLKLALEIPFDSIVCATLGDASLNHSVTQGAINAASWVAHQKLPLPLLLVCEDNGLGISVKTPTGWVERSMAGRAHIYYVYGDALDLPSALEATRRAIDLCRSRRQPVFLHLRTVRLLGHAGSDVESMYLSKEDLEANEAKDPLLRSAEVLVQSGLARADELEIHYRERKEQIEALALRAKQAPKLVSATEVMRPLYRREPQGVIQEACRSIDFVPSDATRPRHMAALINQGLREALSKYPQALVFGEDVAKKGGVYNVTSGLFDQFGAGRVFNTLLDETTILGMAIGAAHLGLLPIPEIQYLAYYHNAEDQIRSEAASLQFFSNGQYQNPMLIRIASFAYQKGFGGHFHNDNALGALRDVPGVILVTPSRGDDAVRLLRTGLALAQVEGRVVFFLEPIALYMAKDLYQPGDGLWQFPYPVSGEALALGEVGVYHPEHSDVVIFTYANGVPMSLRVAARMRAQQGIGVRVVDLRWLVPLPFEAIAKHARDVPHVLVVDECRQTGGGISEGVLAFLAEEGRAHSVGRVAAKDTYIPLGPAANTVLVSEADIEAGVLGLWGRSR